MKYLPKMNIKSFVLCVFHLTCSFLFVKAIHDYSSHENYDEQWQIDNVIIDDKTIELENEKGETTIFYPNKQTIDEWQPKSNGEDRKDLCHLKNPSQTCQSLVVISKVPFGGNKNLSSANYTQIIPMTLMIVRDKGEDNGLFGRIIVSNNVLGVKRSNGLEKIRPGPFFPDFLAKFEAKNLEVRGTYDQSSFRLVYLTTNTSDAKHKQFVATNLPFADDGLQNNWKVISLPTDIYVINIFYYVPLQRLLALCEPIEDDPIQTIHNVSIDNNSVSIGPIESQAGHFFGFDKLADHNIGPSMTEFISNFKSKTTESPAQTVNESGDQSANAWVPWIVVILIIIVLIIAFVVAYCFWNKSSSLRSGRRNSTVLSTSAQEFAQVSYSKVDNSDVNANQAAVAA